MSVFGITQGIPRTERVALSDTSATTIIDATGNIIVVGILLCNDTAGALTPIVDVFDGTNSFVIRDNANLADQASESVTLPDFIQLRKGDKLRVTSAANLNVFASFVEITPARN